MNHSTAPAITSASISNPVHTTATWTARAATASRIGLGALLLFAVANAVFQFAAQPPLPAAAQAFMGGLFSAPYFFALLKGSEFLVALALLSNRFVPLALIVLAPITINIVLFHLVLAPAGAPMGIILLGLHLVAAWGKRKNFVSVLTAK